MLRTSSAPLKLHFKEHRDEYVARLQAIRDDGDWESWIAFFVDGIAQSAKEATSRAIDILALRDRDRDPISRALGGRTLNGLALLDRLFSQPVVSAKLVERVLGVSQPTASDLVNDLADMGLLHELTGNKRDRLFAYREYLDLFPGTGLRS